MGENIWVVSMIVCVALNWGVALLIIRKIVKSKQQDFD